MTDVMRRKSYLIMPTHYVELDNKEMCYVEGGGWQTYTGNAALIEISAMIGAAITCTSVVVTLSKLFATGVITAETGVGAFVALLAGIGIVVSMALAGINVAMAIAALALYFQDGGFQSQFIGLFGYGLYLVKGK